MHDVKWIREHRELFDQGLGRRGLAPLAEKILALDEARRAAVSRLQASQERRNALSKDVGQAKAQKDHGRAEALMAEIASLKAAMPAEEAALRKAEIDLETALAEIPNLPQSDVPGGRDETGNIEYRRHGGPRTYPFEPKQHFELGETLGQMDFEAAAKLSGARFVVLRGGLARLERALGQYMLDMHVTKHGYQEVNPPLLVRDEAMFGTAQLPKFAEDQFAAVNPVEFAVRTVAGPQVVNAFHDYAQAGLAAENSGISPFASASGSGIDGAARLAAMEQPKLWLIPTAEVPLTNLVREAILSEEELPLRFTALTHCFRAEAGAAGRDTRGMIRQHQFQKVELVSITTPEASREEHERMLACAEAVLKGLDLHYRVMTLCTGDMGFASQKTYDIEVWLPGQGMFREISSCSVCGEFQARRMNARYRPREGKGPLFLHTLNGSGVAVGRALIAVLETYQNADGSISVPDALRPYMGGVERIGG